MSDSEEKQFEVTEDGKLKKNEDHPANFEEDLTFDG